METKFTKGKWRMRSSCIGIDIVTDDDKAFGIVDFGIFKELDLADYPKEEAEANALLISKAPEMFEMLQELLKELSYHGYNNSTTIYNAQQLLKEATEL